MPPVGFESTTPKGERPQAQAFDRAATGIGKVESNVVLVYIYTLNAYKGSRGIALVFFNLGRR